MTPVAATDPAEARKRRKEIIQSQRTESETTPPTTKKLANKHVVPTSTSASAAAVAAVTVTEKKPPKKRKIEESNSHAAAAAAAASSSGGDSNKDSKKKTQIRYDPDVPMSKEQLAAWRREARRVRNRESAAASRQRIRNRIVELEEEVGEWKEKYTLAMQRLQSLEESMGAQAQSKN